MHLFKEPRIHNIRIIEGTQKSMHNAQTRIRNELYLTIMYIAKNWYQKENGYENRPQDMNKPQQ